MESGSGDPPLWQGCAAVQQIFHAEYRRIQ
jgi:hypothetical protein